MSGARWPSAASPQHPLSMHPRVYVAAPYAEGPFVAAVVHPALRERDLSPTSGWAAQADGAPERLERLPLDAVRAIAERNDADLASSDLVVVLGHRGTGREMYAEARIAIALGLPVVWVGPPYPLSAYREGVVRVASLEEAWPAIELLAAQLRADVA